MTRLDITDEDGSKLDIKEVFGMGERAASLFVTSDDDPDDLNGILLTVPHATQLRDWLAAFLDTEAERHRKAIADAGDRRDWEECNRLDGMADEPLPDGGKDADSYKLNPGGQRA